jgi:hypothetical protein
LQQEDFKKNLKIVVILKGSTSHAHNYIVMVKKCDEGCIVGRGEGKEKVFRTCYSIELYLKN